MNKDYKILVVNTGATSTNAMDDGSFSIERSGDLPVAQLVKFCYRHFADGKSVEQVQKLLTRDSGVFGYLKTKDLREAEKRVQGLFLTHIGSNQYPKLSTKRSWQLS